jgi:hypothetical protein
MQSAYNGNECATRPRIFDFGLQANQNGDYASARSARGVPPAGAVLRPSSARSRSAYANPRWLSEFAAPVPQVFRQDARQ